ncbi:MAG: hypothetical protein V4687_03030 [Bacteroidota bacterium]
MSLINKLLGITLLILSVSSARAQDYILFKRTGGLKWQNVNSNTLLRQIEVLTNKGDTSLSIFNLYFTSDSVRFRSLQIQSQSPKAGITEPINNDILITIVPLVSPGKTLDLKEISAEEFKSIKVLSHDQILGAVIPKFKLHADRKIYTLPSLKSLKYQLVIQEGKKFFVVKQKVLFVSQLICADTWYFPNQFKEAIFPFSSRFMKAYSVKDIDRFRDGFGDDVIIRQQVQNRIYYSGPSTNNELGLPVYNYWEILNDDAFSIKFMITDLEQYHPGLGSFSFLPKMGIVACTLDYYLTGVIKLDQPLNFKISSINRLSPQKIKEIVKKNEVMHSEN